MMHYTSGRDGFEIYKNIQAQEPGDNVVVIDGYQQPCKRRHLISKRFLRNLNQDIACDNSPAEADPDVLAVDVFLPAGSKISLRCSPGTMPDKIQKVIAAIDARCAAKASSKTLRASKCGLCRWLCCAAAQ